MSPPPPVEVPGPAEVLVKASQENFTVAPRLLPRRVRPHLLSVYGFARLADDIGDEAPGHRVGLLDWLEAELDAIEGGGEPGDPLLRRLAVTVRACALPIEPLRRLIEANRIDQRVGEYDTFGQLLSYCELSANPVGLLVLQVLGAASPDRVAMSDRICTGLQLVEHWQDVGEDLRRGRVYLPREDREAFGVPRSDLESGVASPAFRSLMAFEVGRARSLLAEGLPLAPTLPLRAGIAVAGFVAGGLAALEAIERAGHDVLASTPRASRWMRARAILRALVDAARG